jgi:hypothetical protein
MDLYKIAWALFILGAILAILGKRGNLSETFLWVGLVIAGVGVVLSLVPVGRRQPPADKEGPKAP